MSPDNNNHNPVGSADDEKARSTTGRKTSSAVLTTVPLKYCPGCDSPGMMPGHNVKLGQPGLFCITCRNLKISNHSYVGESSKSPGPEVSDLPMDNINRDLKNVCDSIIRNHRKVRNDAESDHEVDGESSRYQKRAAGSTGYPSILGPIDQFIEKIGNTIGDKVKLDQYGKPRLQVFIALKIFEMAEESGFMFVMDSTNIISYMLRYFEKPLLRACIQEIFQKGHIQKDPIIRSKLKVRNDAEFDHEVDGESSQYQKRAGSTGDCIQEIQKGPIEKELTKAYDQVSDTVETTNITPELESLLGIHTTQFINKFHAKFTGSRYYDISFDRFNLEKFIIKRFFKTAQIVDGIKLYDGVTAEEFSKLFSRYETSLLKDCIIRSQMLDASGPMVGGESSQYQKRAGSTGEIQSFIDQFIEKNGNTIGDDEVKLHQYGMPRLRDFITHKFFQMAEESGLMRVMDDTNIFSNMLMHFEEPLLRACIEEIQKGPIQEELAQPESREEETVLDQRRIRRTNFMQNINLDSAIQSSAVVASHVLSSSNSGVVPVVMTSALVTGIFCSSLAHLLRKHESVSKVLTKVGLMGSASSVILAIATLFPQVIMSCIFGTIAILLLAFTVMMN